MRHKPRLALALVLLSPAAIHAHDGQPEHPPRHGGVVFTSGAVDIEAVVVKPGAYRVYLTDAAGEEVPASTVSAVELSVQHVGGAAEKLRLRIDDSGESWVGAGSLTSPVQSAKVVYRFRSSTVETEIPFASAYHAEFQTSPGRAKAGQPVSLSFTIRDFFGVAVRNLQIVHEKPIHLMVVSSDLAEFYHIHPEPGLDNVFRVSHVFTHGGSYKLYADFTPAGAGNHIESFDLNVAGPQRAAVHLNALSATMTTVPQTSTLGGIRMTLAIDGDLRTGRDIRFAMSLYDASTGVAVRDLQRYLGAWAHIAIVSEDLREFVHVHPIEENAPPSVIRTVAGFRRPGLYKMWVQVRRNGKVIAEPFVIRVGESGGAATPVSQAPSGSVLVTVTSGGFQPSRIPAKMGQTMKIAFYRQDAQNCGREVVFPELGIQRDLPPGKTVVIEVTPRRTGALSFSCGMKMLRGELLVR